MGYADRYFLPVALGLAPAAMLVLTWPDDVTAPVELAKKHALPVIAVELTTIIAAFRSGWRPRFPRGSTAALLALGVIAWTTAFAAPLQLISLMWTGYWVIHLLFGAAVAQLFCPRVAARAVMTGFLFFLILFVIRVSVGPVEDWQQNPPGFDQVRRLGYYAAAVAGLGVGSLGLRLRPFFAFAVTAAAVALLLWTGARGAVAAILVGSIVAAAFLPALRNLRLAGWAFAAAAVGAAVAMVLPVPAVFMGVSRVAALGVDSSGRLELWDSVFRAVLERPWFGWGEAQTKALDLHLVQPHNLFLQILLAWGVIGAGWLTYLAVMAIRRAIPNVRSSDTLLAPAVAASTLLAYSMIDGTLYHVHSTAIFAMCVGLITAGSRDKSEVESARAESSVHYSDSRPSTLLPETGLT
jgi:O-antigen ligase